MIFYLLNVINDYFTIDFYNSQQGLERGIDKYL